MSKQTIDYLIIGNSAAGITAAEYIRATDDSGSITIISREPYAAYGRPLISYLLEGKTTREAMEFKPKDFYRKNRITTLLGPKYEAVSLDAKAHTVELASGETLSYKKCLLATGSVPFVPPIPGLDGAKNVFPFLTLDDALAAGKAADAAHKAAHKKVHNSCIVVVGGGLIGLKAAEALSHHVDKVIVLELAERILPAVLDNEGASILQQQLLERGITCIPGTSASEFITQRGRITQAVLTDGSTINCDVVIAAVGVRPNSALAVEAGAKQGRGLVCSKTLETSLPDVYAAGDVTQVTDLLDGSEHPLALWPNAIRQGKAAGLHMAGAPKADPFLGNFAVNAVDFFDVSLLTAGIINPSADKIGAKGYTVRTVTEGLSYAKFVTKDDKLYGYILLNRPLNAGIYTALMEKGTPLSSFEEDIFDAAPLVIDFPKDERWSRLHRGYPKDLDTRGWKERA